MSELKRREFLKKAGATGAAAAAMSVGGPALATEQTQTAPPEAELPPLTPDASPLLRMQHDLKRALKKPLEQRRWVMVIDLRKCIGCHACTIACIAENKLPPGVVYRPVLEEEIGTYPNVTRRFIPRPCMQCEKPPCVPVCPVNATWKRPDGIVEIDYNKCIGCRYCITACPYTVREFNWGKPVWPEERV